MYPVWVLTVTTQLGQAHGFATESIHNVQSLTRLRARKLLELISKRSDLGGHATPISQPFRCVPPSDAGRHPLNWPGSSIGPSSALCRDRVAHIFRRDRQHHPVGNIDPTLGKEVCTGGIYSIQAAEDDLCGREQKVAGQ